jgi:CDGSH-type Zn-finger protein/uncharacterized Fe-S cluster protein YjdI
MGEGVQEYRGKNVIVRFDGARCIHSRHCVLGQPEVFVANAPGPWIQPDHASLDAVAATVWSCPSGALTLERLDGGEQESAPAVNVVRILENGPLAFRADLRMDGQPATFRATLCRCGASKAKPYCDGSHVTARFVATGQPATQDSSSLAVRNGLLTVAPAKNGPLLAKGNLEICSGTGRTIVRTQSTALCRCGGSANKPFCDGTHGKIGFTAG